MIISLPGLLIHTPVPLFLQSLFVGTVVIFLGTVHGLAGVPLRYVERVRLAIALLE